MFFFLCVINISAGEAWSFNC